MPSLDQFLDILSGCPELRHLSIVGWGPQFEKTTVTTASEGDRKEILDTRIIQLRHLVDFYFRFVDVDYALNGREMERTLKGNGIGKELSKFFPYSISLPFRVWL